MLRHSEKKAKHMKSRSVKVDYLARVEGEGGIVVKVSGKRVTDVKFTIFEPPRFFEAFLRGRHYTEAPDITARICGICPVAYQMSSIQAMENACGVIVDGQLRSLRRLLYCGEWIESHALHIFMLHAPDFLGYADAIQMAKDHGPVVQMALKIKKIGNDIMNVIGGREIHPINVRVGGFYKLPMKAELDLLVERLKWAVDASIQTVKFTSKLTFPDFERPYEYVSLRHVGEYPITEGRLVSNKGLNIDIREYENHFMEEHVSHSNALHSILKERGAYFVGPLARFNLNFDKLTPIAQEAAKAAGIGKGTNNPFKSIIVRSVEMLYACEEALRIIKEYEVPEKSAIEIQPKPGTGYGCSEAPRGLLYHRYRLDERGIILEAKIVPPTAQNQKTMEQDLREYVPLHLNLSQEKLTWQCEQAIRNYDPCISCATHFLKLEFESE
jgi:sulfhydrogenase subunit alpha